MSKDLLLGQIITGDAYRDATHVAVAPVIANERLNPGDHVGLCVPGSTDLVGRLPRAGCLGVVDPFLWEPVEAGQRFYLFMYPGTITGLRHDWTCRAFVAPAPQPDAALNASDEAPYECCPEHPCCPGEYE